MLRSSSFANLQIIASAGAALLFFAPLPVQAAAEEKATASATAAASASAKAGSLARSDAETKYCLREALTGSRVERKFCKTRREWAADGVDIKSK